MLHLEALTEKGKNIFSSLASFSKFYLAGGTALALQIGHRVSIDFDLFSDKPISPKLLDRVKSVFPNKTIFPAVSNPTELTVEVNEVKISFIHYPFPPLLSLVEEESLRLLSVREIGAAKAYTIGRRGEFKDYADIYFLLAGESATLPEIIRLANKKYGREFNDRLFLEQLVYLTDIEETPLLFLRPKVTKPEIKNFFEGKVKELDL